MRKSSLFFKVWGGYFFVILLFFFFILLFSYNTIRHYAIEALSERLQNTCAALRSGVVPLIDKNDVDALGVLLRDTAKETNLRITVLDARGIVVADSRENPKKMESQRDRPEITEALLGNASHAIGYNSTENRDILYVAIPLRKDGRVIGVLRTGRFLPQAEGLLEGFRIDIVKIALVITLLSLIAAYLFSRSVSSPIKELTAAAERVGSGDLSARVLLKNQDEIGILAGTFNHMAEQLASSFSRLSSEGEELGAIIASLTEGLVVLDRRGVILRCNESFETLAGAEHAEGRIHWEVFRNLDFTLLLENARRDRQTCSGEVELADRTYICNVTFLEPGERIVSIFHDVTEIKKLERVKKDFVVNVSHELRTPLTAIKGFLETMEDEVTDQGSHYLTIIKRNTDRLIHIVTDLLLLSELEQKEELQLRKINLKILVQNILPVFDQRIKEKGLTFSLDSPEKLPPIQGDVFKLEQVFVNLMDNALKYTEQGGITLSLQQVDGKVSVQVSDTGIGIPKHDLPRIFERFYVVDKSHSRKFGGTGLGLSIVKHIVFLHNGTIDVQSTQGVGTAITVTLPSGIAASAA